MADGVEESTRAPRVVIISGPNGSGKSTAATRLLPPEMPFVNADMIAQEISGKAGTSADINAGRILLQRVTELEAAGVDFAFETTLATKMLARRVSHWRASGYRVYLIYFWLPSPDLAVLRVAGRVRDGGHNVPEETIRRRYRNGLDHFFNLYRQEVDVWRLYDNSRSDGPELIARGDRTGTMKLGRPDLFATAEAQIAQ